MTLPIRLGLNIDHVATLRNARGGGHPDLLRAARQCVEAGADGITVHLREDRRHIRDADVFELKKNLSVPLNLEMAATQEMLDIALAVKPNAVCIVPEKRTELTTEGGFDAVNASAQAADIITGLYQARIKVSLFIEASVEQVLAAKSLGAKAVELHTGAYAHAKPDEKAAQLARLRQAAEMTAQENLECHAGHGLNYDNVMDVAAIAPIVELNIGHFLVGEALFGGLAQSVRHMRFLMDQAREIENRQ